MHPLSNPSTHEVAREPSPSRTFARPITTFCLRPPRPEPVKRKRIRGLCEHTTSTISPVPGRVYIRAINLSSLVRCIDASYPSLMVNRFALFFLVFNSSKNNLSYTFFHNGFPRFTGCQAQDHALLVRPQIVIKHNAFLVILVYTNMVG